MKYIMEFCNVLVIAVALSLISGPCLFLFWNILVSPLLTLPAMNIFQAFFGMVLIQLICHFSLNKIDVLSQEVAEFRQDMNERE